MLLWMCGCLCLGPLCGYCDPVASFGLEASATRVLPAHTHGHRDLGGPVSITCRSTSPPRFVMVSFGPTPQLAFTSLCLGHTLQSLRLAVTEVCCRWHRKTLAFNAGVRLLAVGHAQMTFTFSGL